jgi:hypothetical protein
LTVEEDYKKAPKYRPFDPSISDINRIMMSLKEKTEAVLERAQPPKTSFFDKVLNKFKWFAFDNVVINCEKVFEVV